MRDSFATARARSRLRFGLLGLLALAFLVQRAQPSVSAGAAASPAPLALGAYVDSAPQYIRFLDQFTSLVGRPPAIVMWYQDWAHDPNTTAFDTASMNAVVSRGATPMITWLPVDAANPNLVQPDYALSTIIAGQHDAFIRSWAQAAAAWGKPFLLRFAHEMNGNWEPWSPGVGSNTAAQYVAAWRHVVTIFRQAGATNVQWVWSPNAVDSYYPTTPFAQIYPGDSYVDWVALDGYNYGPFSRSGWRSIWQVFGRSYEQLVKLTSKPMLLAEISSVENGGDKAAWIEDGLLNQIPAQMPRVRGVIWFDAIREVDWRVNSSPAALAAFRKVAHSPLYSAEDLAAADTASGADPARTAIAGSSRNRSGTDRGNGAAGRE